jgi:hypothetical protein
MFFQVLDKRSQEMVGVLSLELRPIKDHEATSHTIGNAYV